MKICAVMDATNDHIRLVVSQNIQDNSVEMFPGENSDSQCSHLDFLGDLYKHAVFKPYIVQAVADCFLDTNCYQQVRVALNDTQTIGELQAACVSWLETLLSSEGLFGVLAISSQTNYRRYFHNIEQTTDKPLARLAEFYGAQNQVEISCLANLECFLTGRPYLLYTSQTMLELAKPSNKAETIRTTLSPDQIMDRIERRIKTLQMQNSLTVNPDISLIRQFFFT